MGKGRNLLSGITKFFIACILLIVYLNLEVLSSINEHHPSEAILKHQTMSTPRSANPVPIEDVQGDGRWDSMHAKLCSIAKEGKDKPYVFAGDSLIQRWKDYTSWNRIWDDLAINLGIGGDRTEHVLWRISNGELAPMNPKVVVIMAGTNNHGVDAEDTVKGILAIVEYLRASKPSAKVVVMALLPRGEKPNPLREKNAIVNKLLKDSFVSDPTVPAPVYVLDIGHEYLTRDSVVPYNLMNDYLHMGEQGYEIWSAHLLKFIETIEKHSSLY
eukprot:CFRG8391T1